MATYTVTWNDANERFENGDTTLSFNGSTWELTVPDESISNCTASIDGDDVGLEVNLTSTDISWSCGATVTASAGGAGDPHIKPILGKPYTI